MSLGIHPCFMQVAGMLGKRHAIAAHFSSPCLIGALKSMLCLSGHGESNVLI